MYDDLRIALVNAKPAIFWFAMPEAIKLTKYIDIVVVQHLEKPNNETVKGNLMKVATATARFLRQRSADQDVLNILQRTITTIEMEV